MFSLLILTPLPAPHLRWSPDGTTLAHVEFDIYPRGSHVLFEPVMEREQMRRNLEWFQRWIPAQR